MIGRTNVSGGGGVDIQGIIEEYMVASEKNVSAGDFVQYIGHSYYGTDTELDGDISTGYFISATALSDDKVFIASNITNYKELHGIICTISGTTITAGTDTLLSTLSAGTQMATSISAVTLEENKVFIAYDKNLRVYGIVCTISGTTITTGTEVALSSNVNTSYSISATALSNNKVFIAYYGAIVCTISGTTITKGTEITIGSYSGGKISVTTLNTDKVFVAYSKGNASTYAYRLAGIVCTISGTTITIGTEKESTISNADYAISTVKINENKVFIACSYSNTHYLNSITATISGTTITFNSSLGLDTGNGTGTTISAAKIIKYERKCEILVTYNGDTSNYYLKKIVCTISGTTITKGTASNLVSSIYAGRTISSTPLFGGLIFIAHSRAYQEDLYGIVHKFYSIMPYTGANPIVGIAKTKGTGNELIEVYQPE